MTSKEKPITSKEIYIHYRTEPKLATQIKVIFEELAILGK